tara:strand:- start:328 stop:1560 length:1233 start_codon:yes stop_codon:yes gene_type:complete
MSRINRKNIDRKTNKPSLSSTESVRPDQVLNRANETRRDNDIVKTPKRTVYDIDFAIKWFIENKIQPQVEANGELINIPVIYSNGEKWDNVRRLGYLRDQKGMLQSPLIMIKRNSLTERDQLKKLDINRPAEGNQIIYKNKFNKRNRYTDNIFPVPINKPIESKELYAINIPEYVDIEYDLMIWTDFTTQLNEVVEQIMPYGTFAWGNEFNKYRTFIRSLSFETINTVGEDRLVRCTMPLTVNGTLMAEQEYRKSTIQKRYSIKQLSWAQVIDIPSNLFNTTTVPQQILEAEQQVLSGGKVMVSNGGGGGIITVDADAMTYITRMSDKIASYQSDNKITITAKPAINPTLNELATINEFDVFINGQYIDTTVYNWTPSEAPTQLIEFNLNLLGYKIESDDTIIVKGRWRT